MPQIPCMAQLQPLCVVSWSAFRLARGASRQGLPIAVDGPWAACQVALSKLHTVCHVLNAQRMVSHAKQSAFRAAHRNGCSVALRFAAIAGVAPSMLQG